MPGLDPHFRQTAEIRDGEGHTALVVGRPGRRAYDLFEYLQRTAFTVRWHRDGDGLDDVQAADVVIAGPVDAFIPADADPDAARAWARGVLQVVERSGARRLVLISGLAAAGPLGPGSDAVSEDHPENPADTAGHALLAAERTVRDARDDGDTVVLRAGHVFDEHEPGFVGAFLDRMEAEPASVAAQWMDHRLHPVYAPELAWAVTRVALEGHGLYHVSEEINLTVGEMVADILQCAARVEVPLTFPEEGRATAPDPASVHWRYPHHRMLRELSFKPHRPFCDAIAMLMVPRLAVMLQRRHGLDIPALRWRDRWWCLRPEDRDEDVAAATLTLHGLMHDERQSVDASVFSAVSRPRARTRSLRVLMEDMLRRDVFPYWVKPALGFAAIQGLVTLPADAEAT